MANNQNLIPQAHKLTVEEASKGGKASVKARREKKDLRLALEMLLEKDFPQKDKDGNVVSVVSGADAIATKLFEQAMKGNVKAFGMLRDTVGQMPIQKVMVAEIDESVIDEVERAVLGNDERTGN